MPDTPIYALTYPAVTGLVTDGATNMQTICTDVETALNTQTATNDGRNWVDNPQFVVNYRNGQTITAGAYGYVADRWLWEVANATSTFARTTIALGTAGLDPSIVRGMSANTTVSTLTTSLVHMEQLLDGVERLSNRTVVLSFYAKAATGTPKIGARLVQNFGTGGSPSAEVALAVQTATLTTGWVRYSFTFTLASVAGKTLGTGNDDHTRIEIIFSGGSGTIGSAVGNQVNTLEVTGVQLEVSFLTPFEFRYEWVDNLRCQRFFTTSYQDSIWVLAGGAGAASQNGKVEFSGTTNGGNAMYYTYKFPVIMQRTPTMRFYVQTTGALGSWDYARSGATGVIAVGTAANGLSPLGFILVNSASLGATWVAAQYTGQWAASIDGW